MKKFIISILILMFFVISCHSSKKAENDADILPDEDAADVDEQTDNEENEIDDGNPCSKIANSDGEYTHISAEKFKCDCLEGYFWANPGCKKTTYANICTGQKQCCGSSGVIDCPEPGEDYYGQDPQYEARGYCTKSSFKIDKSVENEETIKDENLKIEWMRKAAESEYTWEDAVKYCEDLEFGGHDDWRLPNPKEMLFSTLSSTMQDTDKNFWSGTPKHSDNIEAWGLYNNGEDITITTWSKTSSLYVRCVREEAPAEPLFKVFEIAGNKIVRDFDSGLAWTEKPERISSWKEALAYCENLYYAGVSDWRVPNIHELISLADHEKSNPATSFPDAENGFARDLISSTTYRFPWGEYSKTFKYIAFDTGKNDRALKQKDTGFYFYALCVRNEPCREHYWWNGKKCVKDSGCADNPCNNDEHSNGICTTVHLEKYSCGCVEKYFWNGEKCVSQCNPNLCMDDKNSTGECKAPDIDTHECVCIDGYFWDGEKCVNPCDGVSCSQFEHGAGKCRTDNAFTFRCGCVEGYYWWGQNKGCLEKKPDLAHICTGQTKCYDDEKEIECPAKGEKFYGQDAQYADLGYCAPPSYTIEQNVENEPVVIDNYTGLSWHQNVYLPQKNIPWSQYKSYCETSNYGGYDDWRLPSILEYRSIMDFGRHQPNVDPKYFPNTPPEYFVTSSFYKSSCGFEYTSDSTEVYLINFDHIATSHYSGLCESDPQIWAPARCVRGNKSFSERSMSELNVSENKSLYVDNKNSILWVGAPGGKKWAEALDYCENLTFAGLSDWRLTNINESSLFVENLSNRDPAYSYYYSSTTEEYDPTRSVQDKLKIRGDYMLCVRDNPCETGELWDGTKCAKNPCAGNPCKSDSNSNGTCTVLDEENYSCNCNKNYKWSPEKLQCVRTCQDNPCSTYSNSDKQCYDDDVEGFYCGCIEPYYWNSEKHTCSKKCDSDPCADKENSDGHCSDDTEHGYVCGCIDGYVWLPFYDMCYENLCISDPCENIENSDGTCEINEYLGRECGCIEGYTWNFSDGECR